MGDATGVPFTASAAVRRGDRCGIGAPAGSRLGLRERVDTGRDGARTGRSARASRRRPFVGLLQRLLELRVLLEHRRRRPGVVGRPRGPRLGMRMIRSKRESSPFGPDAAGDVAAERAQQHFDAPRFGTSVNSSVTGPPGTRSTFTFSSGRCAPLGEIWRTVASFATSETRTFCMVRLTSPTRSTPGKPGGDTDKCCFHGTASVIPAHFLRK